MLFKIPPKAQSGVLTIDSKDVTCFVRKVGIPEGSAPSVDIGTWCDPGAVQTGTATKTLDVEWLNSFKGTTADLGLYDELKALAGSGEKDVVFTPFGSGGPSWAFKVTVPDAPLGDFTAEQPVIVNTSWGISGLVYTAATTSST